MPIADSRMQFRDLCPPGRACRIEAPATATETPVTKSAPYTGQALPRREDPRLLRGEGQYTGDIHLPGALHLAFLRSSHASGRLDACDVTAARAMPGVAAVLTAADLGALGRLEVNPVLPLDHATPYPILAGDTVSAVGQPIAAVLAETPGQALDAVEEIWAEIDETPSPPSELMAMQHWQSGDPAAEFARAAHVVAVRIAHPRLAPSPMEPRAIAILPESHGLTVWLSTQTPHRARADLARILSLDPEHLRVIARDVGGAFGMKASLYPEEVLAVRAAHHLGRPVRWTATRSEEFLSATHGRGLTSEGQLAIDAEGRFLALKARVEAPLGHWLPNSALIPAWNAARILPGPYDIAATDLGASARRAHTAPTGIYRGAGRPEACALMERLADAAARATGLDPAEIRRRNLNRLNGPRDLPAGRVEGADYATALDRFLTLADYPAWCAQRDARRADGALAGIGLGFYVEPSGKGWESARVTLEAGRATVEFGGSSQGHGRETALAQIAADALELSPSDITVLHGDTATCPPGIGALASRSTPIGASAVLEACREIIRRRDAGATCPITADTVYTAPGEAWGHGCYLAAIEIDRDTGAPQLTHMACLDDAGRLINPMLAEGQVMGGFAQGLGEAMLEALHFDEGQLLTGSFMDYAMPRADDLPSLTIHKTETLATTNALGAKGIGEAGTIGAPAAILNAALDALAPLGVTDLQMPLTSLSLWQAITDASKEPQT
ncbi:xanthine dehydrogenase family protein molybdopterin-binding subunit [Ruegeria pomeroyi]|nr:xanthine dehydrogenase family protein molybdopterin-binding subunit [Ruegeria pomeroyi]